MLAQIIGLAIDIALGALAYRLARKNQVDIELIRTELSELRKKLE